MEEGSSAGPVVILAVSQLKSMMSKKSLLREDEVISLRGDVEMVMGLEKVVPAAEVFEKVVGPAPDIK